MGPILASYLEDRFWDEGWLIPHSVADRLGDMLAESALDLCDYLVEQIRAGEPGAIPPERTGPEPVYYCPDEDCWADVTLLPRSKRVKPHVTGYPKRLCLASTTPTDGVKLTRKR